MMSWNQEQQRLLRAMGYVLYARAPMPAPSSPAAHASVATSDLSRLLHSLQRTVPGRDVSTLIADVAALRGDARAKRALWPILRALRRSH
jgi:hypothetical protein